MGYNDGMASTNNLSQTLRDNYRNLILIVSSFIVGVLWLGALRFFLVQPEETHFHANFAVYVDGVREEFKSFTYYEEVAACTGEYANNPKGRTHMHDNVNDVIHVHDKRVTYADFFNNINWTLGPDFVRNDSGLITSTADKSWVFILNGEKKERVDNRMIGDQDNLLISYGSATTDFDAQFETIENKAKEHDAKNDPSSCSGLNGPSDDTVSARIKRAFLFSE